MLETALNDAIDIIVNFVDTIEVKD